MPNKKLLLISYVFPPAGGVAVLRALSMAKYLPRLGYEVHVLTAGNAAAPTYDPDLLEHVPPEVTVHRCFTPELPFHFRKKLWNLVMRPAPSGNQSPARSGADAPKSRVKAKLSAAAKRLLCPDPQVVWAPFAQRRAAQIIRKYGIDVVMVTAPPFSVFLTGNVIKRRFPRVKLISDFRDEWMRFYLADFDFLNNDHTRRRAEAIERTTIEGSDLVVAVTRSSRDEIRGRYPEQPEAKFELIPNGFDPDVFATFTPRHHGKPKVVVTYLGTIYKTSSPAAYLDALDALPDEIRSCFETRFVGRVVESEQAVLQGRRSSVKVLGFRSQKDAIAQAEETDYLLLTMNNDFMLPGKLFEYLPTGKPILAVAPPSGEIAGILKETGAGWCADARDRAGLQAMLIRAYEQARGGGSLQLNFEAIRRYDRRRLAERLDASIRALLERSAGSREQQSVATASPELFPLAQMQSQR